MTEITVLMDNSPGMSGTEAEHGLSLFIESSGGSLIFDTGKTGAFLRNALVLGADLKKAGSAVISHGHYDHAGGVKTLIESGGFTGSLWTGPGFFRKKWKDDRKPARYLGIDFDGDYLQSRGVHHRTAGTADGSTEKFEIVPGIFAINGFPRIHPGEVPDPLFTVDREDGRVSDDFGDEICLVIEQTEGIAVVLGCAHPGIMNMLDSCRAVFGKPLKAWWMPIPKGWRKPLNI